MMDFIKDIGLNAGCIWELLSDKGPMVCDQIIRKTGLTKKEFSTAVGWLARENKIKQDGEVFEVGETNLTNKIGMNAGFVMQLMDFSSDFFSAVGWLAREGKITEENLSGIQNLNVNKPKHDRTNLIIKELVTELENRNNIIRNLSNQLNDKHNDIVQNCESIEFMRSEIIRHQKNSKMHDEMLDKKEKNIISLKVELENKNLEIDELKMQLKQGNHMLKMENDELKTILKKMPVIDDKPDSNNLSNRLCNEDQIFSNLNSKNEKTKHSNLL